jgi:hypothetical protein
METDQLIRQPDGSRTRRRLYVLEVRRPGQYRAPASAGVSCESAEVKFRLLVEQQETYSFGEHTSASGAESPEVDVAFAEKAAFDISYDVLSDGLKLTVNSGKGHLQATYARQTPLGPLAKVHGGGGLFLFPVEIRRFKVGPYLQDQIIRWVKRWPAAHIDPVQLIKNQAVTAEDRNSRNRFWRRYGFEFNFHGDAEEREGTSNPMLADELRVPVASQSRYAHITRLTVAQYRRQLSEQCRAAADTIAKYQMLVEEMSRHSAFAHEHPVRWAMSLKGGAVDLHFAAPSPVAVVPLSELHLDEPDGEGITADLVNEFHETSSKRNGALLTGEKLKRAGESSFQHEQERRNAGWRWAANQSRQLMKGWGYSWIWIAAILALLLGVFVQAIR